MEGKDNTSLCPWVEHPSARMPEWSGLKPEWSGLVFLLGPAFDKEPEVLSTYASEAFFIDCISSLRDFIACSMDA